MKNKLFRSPLTCLGLVILLISSCSKQQPLPTPILIAATPYSVAVYKDVAYTSERNLDVYAPSTPGNWPVVVLFNGTSKEAYAQLSSAIAAHGAVVFNPDIPTKPSNFSPVEHIAQGLEDAACALRFGRFKAEEFGGNPARVVVVGHSIGGVAAADMMLAGDDFKGDCLVRKGSALPDAFIGLDGAYDIDHCCIPDFMFAEASPEKWAVLSPFTYVDRQPIRKGVEFHLIVGDEAQELVDMSRAFYEALKTAGYEATLLELSNTLHMDFLGAREEWMQVILETLER